MEYVIIAVLLIVLFLVSLWKEEKLQNINVMAYSTDTIANYFIKKHGEYGELTPMKLIKLVYIAYGWYLTTFNSERLVDEHPQAWRHGPVFPSLYSKLKMFGKDFVKEPLYTFKKEEIKEKDAEFLDKVWKIYGEKDGIYLSALTHQADTPWSITYPRGENIVIPDNEIESHYNKLSS